MMGNVKVPWLVALVIITYRDMRKGSTNNVGGLPLPADYLASFAIFGALSLFTGEAERIGTVAGWGFVVAMLLNLPPTNLVPSGKTSASQDPTSASTSQKKAA